MFAQILSRYWWMTMARGVIWILFGVFVIAGLCGVGVGALTFFAPGVTAFALLRGFVRRSVTAG